MGFKKWHFILLASMSFWAGCADSSKEKKKTLNPNKITKTVSALPKKVLAPLDNSTTEEKIALGRMLFFDPILSGSKDIACVTCHHPSTGYAEFLDLSMGTNASGLGSKREFNSSNDIPLMKRNSQTVLNTAFNGIGTNNSYNPETAPMFWDTRVQSLETQALEPIKAFEEMRGHEFLESEILDEVVRRLNKIPEYRTLFEKAFANDEITSDLIAKAIASFERSLITNNTRFDRYMRGESDAILISEKDGFELFKKVGCINCHNGPMFSDYEVHVLGTPLNKKLLENGKPRKDSLAFRTPSLRNLRFTAPYMHNGSLETLRRVLEFYEDIANGKNRNSTVPQEQIDPLVHELELSVKDMSLIISFLNTLNDEDFDKSIPENVPSGLPVGGNMH